MTANIEAALSLPISQVHLDEMHREAQRVVIASILTRPDVFTQVAALSPEAFRNHQLRIVFSAMKAMAIRGDDISLFGLAREIGDKLELPLSFIAGLQNDTVPCSDLSGQLTFLQEQRQVLVDEISRKQLIALLNQGKPLADILDAGRKMISQEEAAPARGKLAFVSAADLSTRSLSLPWLIKDFLPADAVVSIFGGSGSGKSFLALDWLLCIASRKKEWMGNPVKRRGTVFYIAGEGYSGLPGRIKAWCFRHSVSIESLKFFSSNQSVPMLEPEAVAELVAAIDEMAVAHGQPVAVCVDTLARCFGPGDENSSRDMSTFVAALDKIRSLYACAVLVVHHSGLGDDSRSRGSSAFRAALDAEYRLSVSGETRILCCTKAKDTEPPADLHLVAEKIELGEVDEDGRPIVSLVFTETEAPAKPHKKLSANNVTALRALEHVTGDLDYVHLETWRAEFYSRSTEGSQEAKKKAFQRARKELVNAGHVSCRDDQYWPFVVPGQSGQFGTNVPPCPALAGTNRDKAL